MDYKNTALEKLLKASNHSIYKLTILLAKRAISLTEGKKPLIEKTDGKILDVVLKEIETGKIKVKEKK